MKSDPSLDHTLREQPPTEKERNLGVLTVGIIALVAVSTAIYWAS